MLNVEIIHHENGDSEFTFPIKMTVGASDKGCSSVTYGTGELYHPLTIYQQDKNQFRVFYKDDWLSPVYESKEECINWIIKNLKGT